MTERELAGIVASLQATAMGLESAANSGQTVNTPNGMAVLVNAEGAHSVVRCLREVADLLLEAIPNSTFYVERNEKEQQKQESAQEAGETPEEG